MRRKTIFFKIRREDVQIELHELHVFNFSVMCENHRDEDVDVRQK